MAIIVGPGITIGPGIVVASAPEASNSINFDTAGANTWTVPASITSVTIKLWGGGGASGGTGYIESGGGGGGYASKVLTVTPAQVLSFTVGTGGPNVGVYTPGFPFGIYTPGSNGTASTYSTISAGGGSGYGDPSPGQGANGRVRFEW